MTSRSAALRNVGAYNARALDTGDLRRALFNSAALCLGAVSAAGVVAASATAIATWLVSGSLGNSHSLQAPITLGAAAIAMPVSSAARPAEASEATGSPSLAPALVPAAVPAPAAVPTPVQKPVPTLAHSVHTIKFTRGAELAVSAPLLTHTIRTVEFTREAEAVPVAAPVPAPHRVAERANRMPLPAQRPAPPPQMQARAEAAHHPGGHAALEVVASLGPALPAPDPNKTVTPHNPQLANINPTAIPGSDSHTAVYDIVAHTVYLPNGERLEAHSGLGRRLDDPRYIRDKARGPTPPNVYDLTLRGQLFHGVRAIRLNPVSDSKMFGRDGILAHTYMLGPSGQSFGCVSFKDYQEFLRAYQRGEINRMVVVPHLEAPPFNSARARRERTPRYSSNS